MEKQIEKLMKTLNVSRAEALEIIETDKRIDKGEKLFDLDPELEAGAKKARQADRAKSTEPVKRERKANLDKQAIINRFVASLENWFASDSQHTFNACTNIEVANPEREFTFTYNDVKYKVVLSAPRS